MFKRASYNYCRQQETSITSAAAGNSTAPELRCLVVYGSLLWFQYLLNSEKLSDQLQRCLGAVIVIREICDLINLLIFLILFIVNFINKRKVCCGRCLCGLKCCWYDGCGRACLTSCPHSLSLILCPLFPVPKGEPGFGACLSAGGML